MAEFNAFLRGIRVLDLSQYIPGPMAGLFLADMGAEVLKIEPPNGDGMQHLGPRDADDRPIFYRAMNAGKTVQRMNLKDAVERAAFLDLVRDADVLIEGFRPGVMKRLGIDFPVLHEVNPSLIVCSISGYGANASLGPMAGHDANYLAMMGMLDRNGSDGPVFFDPPVSDLAGSLFAATTILGALHGRRNGSGGCHIDLALADTVMPLQMMQVADYGANGTVPGRGETYLNGGAAYYQVYRTADRGHVIIGAVERKFWEAFCAAADRPDWVGRHAETLPQHALRREVAAFFAGMSVEEAYRRFGHVDCCFSVVNDLGEALSTRHLQERELVRTNEAGDLQALFPVRIDGTPPANRPAVRDAGSTPAFNGFASTRSAVTASNGDSRQARKGSS